MPAKRVRRAPGADVQMQDIDEGACIYIPTKRNRKTKYPKSFDPENPGPTPDPERWLPKWQRSKYKKLAKKKGIYLKGAQGDAQVDTDVNKVGSAQSSAQVQASSSNKNKRKGRR